MLFKTEKTEVKLIPTTGYVPVGKLFVCNCGIPLAKRNEDGYELLKYYRGKPAKIKVEFGSMGRVKCEECGRGFVQVNLYDSFGIS